MIKRAYFIFDKNYHNLINFFAKYAAVFYNAFKKVFEVETWVENQIKKQKNNLRVLQNSSKDMNSKHRNNGSVKFAAH